MERGNTTTAAGGLSTTSDGTGVAATTDDPCVHCGFGHPTAGEACDVCGLMAEETVAGPTPLWAHDICGESNGVDEHNECLACGMEVEADNMPPEKPSMTITRPDGTSTTVEKNWDGTITWSGAPPPGAIGSTTGGGLAAINPYVDWRALSQDADGNSIEAGYGPFGNRLVRTTRPDGSGTLRVNLTQEAAENLAPLAGAIEPGEHIGYFDADGNITDSSGKPFGSP